MISRRDVVLGGAAMAVGLGATATWGQTDGNRGWTALPNGQTARVNGTDYEAECGRDRAALQRSRGGVFRFSMIPGNLWPNDDPNDSERTELDGWRGRVTGPGPLWMSWSMFYEPGAWSTADWCILRQVYARYASRGSPWSVLLLKPGGQLLWVGSAADDPTGAWPLRHRQQIPQGQWLHFVEAFKFDPEGGKGYWRSWLNGQQVLDFSGAVGKAGVVSRYAKFGIYRSRTQRSGQRVAETVNIRFVNMRFGTDDLSELIDKPEPVPAWESWS
jgi:hypothetical protein